MPTGRFGTIRSHEHRNFSLSIAIELVAVYASSTGATDGHLEANLESWYTAAGRAYFATDEGKAELAQLVNYIKTHKLKPQYK